MKDDPLVNYKKAFYDDGSFRDIYIFGTDERDWQKLLAFLRSSTYTIEFSVDDQPTPLPEQVETIFTLRDDHSTILHIDKEHLSLTSFFFTSEEIEFDLDPRDFQGEVAGEQIARLLDFIRTVGRLLGKAVILTLEGGSLPEGGSLAPLFRFDPGANEEKWYSENIEREYQWAMWSKERT
jgi:hypothetical protein